MNYTIERGMVSPELDSEFLLLFRNISEILNLIGRNLNEPESFRDDKKIVEFDAADSKLVVVINSVKPTYAYARDSQGNSFFVPLSSFNTREVLNLRVGQRIKIWGYQENDLRDGARKANHASL